MVEYNPMTGTRRDLEVEREDGDAAVARHRAWRQKRMKYLESLLETCSEDTREMYLRELATLKPTLAD